MMMQRGAKIFMLLAHIFLYSCAHSKDFVLYQQGQKIPVLFAGSGKSVAAKEFVQFCQKLGVNIKPVSEKPKDDRLAIILSSDPSLESFALKQSANQLHISGNSINGLRKGLRYFFSHYTSLNQFNYKSTTLPKQVQISVPEGLDYTSNRDFRFVEPYFSQNFNEDFRLWNNTNTIEETWGLWGHNLGKFIRVTPEMYAIINGKPNDEQLNFSSKALQKALESAIQEHLIENPAANHFMIMPYDNELVCQCASCLAQGNTATSASPAVYHLLTELAAKFPKAKFFSTAYLSTEKAPKNKLPQNAGVMISTMSFPKGTVLENHKKALEISAIFQNWRNLTSNIYLWDYAINFDNYFEFYPTVSVAQKNLKFFKENGVTGVFMHGSDEGSFAAFGDLKCYLYAQLLNNLNVDLDQETRFFLTNTYSTMGKELSDYYTNVEHLSLNSSKTLDIYGGIKYAVNKYLNQDYINKYLNIFLKQQTLLKADERSSADLILMSFLFQSLELQRINGIGNNGYATYVGNKLVLEPNLLQRLALLKKLALRNRIDVYNESKASLLAYLDIWQSRIVDKPYYNLFYQKPFSITTALDEDYANKKMLNDGAFGFYDYDNNWLINSQNVLRIEVDLKDLRTTRTINFSFLNDKQHHIYLPGSVTVSVGDRKFEKKVSPSDKDLAILTVNIPVEIRENDSTIVIEITKQAKEGKSLIACDEIIFK
jgi:hypothetical protein